MRRTLAYLVFGAIAACGGTFSGEGNEVDAGGTGGNGGAMAGSGGNMIGGAAGAGGIDECPPLAGCDSRSLCSDGCNTCSCIAGGWACTLRACPPDGGSGGADAGAVCNPLPGCSSNTQCSDGCNSCACWNGQWACTARACPPVDDAGVFDDAARGACSTEADCYFEPNAACCGACQAKTDPQPPPVFCDVICPPYDQVPLCACISHKCSTAP